MRPARIRLKLQAKDAARLHNSKRGMSAHWLRLMTAGGKSLACLHQRDPSGGSRQGLQSAVLSGEAGSWLANQILSF
jgi:hypothetical protein